jgi:hypothetical protein
MSEKFLNQIKESTRKQRLDLINKNLLANYEKILEGENIKGIINNQRRFITKMDLQNKYKNKHISVEVLEHYHNTKNKEIALNNLTNYLCNKHLF